VASLGDAAAELLAQAEKTEEAWNRGSEAKETAGEVIDSLVEIMGDSTPEELVEAVQILRTAQNSFEEGQAFTTVAKEQIQSYLRSIGY